MVFQPDADKIFRWPSWCFLEVISALLPSPPYHGYERLKLPSRLIVLGWHPGLRKSDSAKKNSISDSRIPHRIFRHLMKWIASSVRISTNRRNQKWRNLLS